jgi:hypothetical protein
LLKQKWKANSHLKGNCIEKCGCFQHLHRDPIYPAA